jgi:hypothetical protein
MAKAKKKIEVEVRIPTIAELIQAKIPCKKESANTYFSVKDLKEKYPFLTNHNHDEKTFDDDFVGIMIADLQIEK